MLRPTLKQLEAFYWAASCTSFSEAASRANISTSSLSKRIAELEGTVKRALFDRGGHKAALTHDGIRLLPAAARVLDTVRALGGAFDEPAVLSGKCRLGVGELSALTWLPSLVRALQHDHPALEIETFIGMGPDIERMVEDRSLDCAFLAGHSHRDGLSLRPVCHGHFTWMASPRIAAAGMPVTQALFDQHALITLPHRAGTTRMLDQWLDASRLTAPNRIECNSLSGIAGMIREGLGIGFLPTGWTGATSDAQQAMVVLSSSPALPGLPYSFQSRRNDTRALIGTMHALIQTHANFARKVW